MPNMSYCRFENTLNDLVDCLNAIEEEGMDTLQSRYEREAAASLARIAEKFARSYKAAKERADFGITPDE